MLLNDDTSGFLQDNAGKSISGLDYSANRMQEMEESAREEARNISNGKKGDNIINQRDNNDQFGADDNEAFRRSKSAKYEI